MESKVRRSQEIGQNHGGLVHTATIEINRVKYFTAFSPAFLELASLQSMHSKDLSSKADQEESKDSGDSSELDGGLVNLNNISKNSSIEKLKEIAVKERAQLYELIDESLLAKQFESSVHLHNKQVRFI
jgi:hypothetical protein